MAFGHAFLRARWLVVIAILAITAAAATQLRRFGLDAGAYALLLETDPELRFYDQTRLLFGTDEYILIAFRSPDPFSDESLRRIEALTEGLGQVPGVAGVMSLTNVALLRSPPFLLPRTILSEGVDRELARAELLEHEVFGQNLVSRDGRAACLIVTLSLDPRIPEYQRQVFDLDREIEAHPERARELRPQREAAHAEFRKVEDVHKRGRVAAIGAIREVLARHPDGEFFQSGLPVINVDMVRYIERDIRLFGTASAAFFVLVLAIIFRRKRWVLLPLVTCIVTVTWVLALMVLAGKKTTIVTSNLSSLLFILGMEHTLHLVERYREVLRGNPGMANRDVIREMVRQLWAPALFTATTTIAGFSSLVISDIRPVIDFGIYMSIGVGISFLVSFAFFPAALAILPAPPVPPSATEGRSGFGALARFTVRWKWGIAAASVAVLAGSVAGIFRLEFETRFVDYFRPESEISRGLFFIDSEMGGTTSLEVVMEADAPGYFATEEGLARLGEVESHLEGVAEIGKVISLHSVVSELRKAPQFSRGAAEAQLRTLARNPLVGPLIRSYATEDYRVARVFARLRETSPTLERNRILGELREWLESREELRPLKPRLTGVFLLYANLLNSLIGSQMKTFALALGAIVVMLAVLFRSVRIALLGIIPNALPILFVLGFMGWVGIHLDMMTVTIASVSLGIAVDGTIHYVFRHRREWEKDGSYEGALVRAHESVGRPVLWTSICVVVAFCVLALSAFKPTMYFGLLTALAMLGGLFGSLTVLPVCLVLFKPYGRRP